MGSCFLGVGITNQETNKIGTGIFIGLCLSEQGR
jgi:hypothetical protein